MIGIRPSVPHTLNLIGESSFHQVHVGIIPQEEQFV